MKALLSIILVFSFLLQNISKLVIVINYGINKEYIAKNLCVNKDKPDSCCQGKCELKKQLDEEEKKENQPANTFKDKFEKQNYYGPETQKLAGLFDAGTINYSYVTGKTTTYSPFIFHPPPFSA